jgi:hypothetical protein
MMRVIAFNFLKVSVYWKLYIYQQMPEAGCRRLGSRLLPPESILETILVLVI